MIVSEELTERDIQTVIHRLGIEPKGRTDSNGWTTIKSPLRDERNPSFGINLQTGAWKDHGTDESGDLVTLTERVQNFDTKEAISWIKEQTDLSGALYSPPSNGSSRKTKPKKQAKFWTDDNIKLLSDGQKRLKGNPDHEVIKQAKQYDCLSLDTLQFFGVGLIEKWQKDWLAFPYKTGCQLYRREDGKVIRSLKGSSPGESFFGSRKVDGNADTLYIAKSPRECMLLYQQYGNRADVIGIATGEQGKLSSTQIESLKNEISASNYSNIYVFMDCDSEAAEITAKSFCGELSNALNRKIQLVNIHSETGGAFKDITECIQSGMDEESFNIMLEDAKEFVNAKNAEDATLEKQLDIQTAPEIPNQVYNKIPGRLKNLCSLIEPRHRRDVFLIAALPVISSQIPNVLAAHRDRYYSPDVFVQIVAGPGMGKGEATKSKGLAFVADNKIREAAKREREAYDGEGELPKKQSLFIPANASSRKMLDRLEANDGQGLIFENEIDTLINATKQDWGNYTDTVRKSFHHESLSIIRTDGEFYIENPRLSVCLTGTFDQFKTMFESAENGHFSRYALYTFDAPREWQSHRPTKQSKMLIESVENSSKELYEMYQRLSRRQDPLFIALTESQWQAIDDTFAEKMQIIEDLGLSSHLHASNNRAAIIALRLAMIFTVLRANDEDPNRLVMEKSLTPSTPDMEAALLLADIFIKHAIRLYHILPEAKTNDSKGERFQNFLAKLPYKFTTAKAVEVGEQLNIPERTVKYWLSNDENINKERYGHYAKM